MNPIRHRASAATTDPATLTAKVDRIRDGINRNPHHRYETLTTPLNDGERFAVAEAEEERRGFGPV